MNIAEQRTPHYLNEIRGDKQSMVTHYRFVNNAGSISLMPLYDIRKKGLSANILPHGGGVKVVLTEKGNNYVGYSFSSINDRFIKRNGNVKAFRSALNQTNCNAVVHKKGGVTISRCEEERQHTKLVLKKFLKFLPEKYREELESSEIKKAEEKA